MLTSRLTTLGASNLESISWKRRKASSPRLPVSHALMHALRLATLGVIDL